MRRNILLLLGIVIFLSGSCTKKNDDSSNEGFSRSNSSNNESTGFDNQDDDDSLKAPLNIFLSGCYQGTLYNKNPSDSDYISIYIDASNVNKTGWGSVRIGIKNGLSSIFNITTASDQKSCVTFSKAVTNQTIEYWYDKTVKKRGANISLMIPSFDATPKSANNCKLFGSPVRLDLRLVFLDNNEGEEGPVNSMEGTYTLYYANIQKALIRNRDPRSENPDYCCRDSDDNPDICTENVIELDINKDLSYFSGFTKDPITKDLNCNINTQCGSE